MKKKEINKDLAGSITPRINQDTDELRKQLKSVYNSKYKHVKSRVMKSSFSQRDVNNS